MRAVPGAVGMMRSWLLVPVAYLGQMGLPFLSMGGVLMTILVTAFGFLLAPFRHLFKQFKGGNRRWAILLAILLAIGVGVGVWWNARSSNTPVRVIVLGLDGLDPKLLEQFMDQGLLPHFQMLRKQGSYSRLGTTYPPLSPVAWSSFTTGSNPGRHGLFDFLRRDPNTYLPDLAMAETQEPKTLLQIGAFKLRFGNPHLATSRKGVAFWDVTSKAKIPTVIIRTPVTFPPDKVHGRMLSGLGVPDLRGTQGTFSFYTTDSIETGKAMGGQIIQVKGEGDTIHSQVFGPRNTFVKPATDTKIPLSISIYRDDPHIAIDLQGQRFDLPVGQWSEWKKVTFTFNPLAKASGIVRFYLGGIDPLQLYLSPINFDPRSPAFPISYPPKYAKELAKEIGLYYTIGQAEDTWSLNEGRVSDETFLQQCQQVIKEREAMLLRELKRFKNGLLVCCFDTPDRVQHMFWRFHDPGHPLYNADEAKKFEHVFPNLYQSMDRILGEIMEHVDDDTVLIVLSDHGFSQFRTAVHTNAWLREKGFLVFRPDAPDEGIHDFFAGVDWSKTKAYAVGLSGIYLNRQGRERHGIVGPDEAPKVDADISKALLELTDPSTGKPIVKHVYRKEEIYEGPMIDNAPDLFIGFEEGYRTSWQTALGSTPKTQMEPNAKRWSGDHCIDPPYVSGVLLVNRHINTTSPRIIDIAPTILQLFGLEPPASVDGKALIDG